MNNYSRMSANESMFDAEQTTASLLDAVRANVESSVNTIDQACELENKLSEEASQFNDLLTTMSNAIRKCERGETSREEMLAECAPCVSALKSKCTALSLANVDASGDDITEDEIAMLREYIVGCKDIVAERKRALQDSPVASEGFLAALSKYDPAIEGTSPNSNNIKQLKKIRQSTQHKTATQLYKQAKKLYSLGSKEKAKKTLSDAQKMYEKLLAQVEKIAGQYEVERKSGTGAIIGFGGITGNVDTYKKKVTDSAKGASLIAYYEDRIDSCKALRMQWDNKAGKSTFAETKEQLRLERKKIKAGQKARRKAARGVDKMARESAIEFMNAMEAFADDTFLQYDLDFAMEAEGAEDEGSGASANEQKLAELNTQFNEAKANNDTAAMERIKGEIQKTLDAVEKEAADAYSADDMKAADRKRAKIIAVVAAIVAVGAGTAAGVKTGAFKNIATGLKAKAQALRDNKGKNKGESAKGKGSSDSARQSLKKFKISDIFKKKHDNIDSVDEESWIDSMESYMDNMEIELALEAAMESEDGESEGETKTGKISAISSKIRGAFSKLKKAKAEGNDSEAAAAEKEVAEGAKELDEAIDDAETPEEKKKASKAAKIAAAAAAVAVTATVGVTVAGKKLENISKQPDAKPVGKIGSALIAASKAVRTSAPAKGIKNRKDYSKYKKDLRNQLVNASDDKADGKQMYKDAVAPYKTWKANKDSWTVLEGLLYGLEGVTIDDEEIGDNDGGLDYVEPEDGKAIDDEDLMDIYGDDDEDEVIEAMLAEDGIDDSDLY